MIVQQGSGTILTRWYPSDSYIKETAGSVTKEYTFIGGDEYTAPVVAITQNDTTTYYNLLRDYLGSITHVVNSATNAVVAEYSYDAWGRMAIHLPGLTILRVLNLRYLWLVGVLRGMNICPGSIL